VAKLQRSEKIAAVVAVMMTSTLSRANSDATSGNRSPYFQDPKVKPSARATFPKSVIDFWSN
jgi:hypothetical protein